MPPSVGKDWTGDEDPLELLAVLVLLGYLNPGGLEVLVCWLRAVSATAGLDDVAAVLLLDMAGKELARLRGLDPATGSVVPDDARELDPRRDW